MYIPKAFHVSDSSVLEAFITHHSFATLVSTVDGRLLATHLPLLLDRTESAHGVLLGHVARANPHWRAFDGQEEALAMFHGPHAYISPSWYTTAPAVPTWNYAVVHLYGVPRVVDDEVWLAHLVDRLVARYEADMPAPWPGALPAAFKADLLKAIVGFTMEITRVEGKFKLGQNRPRGDQLGVARQLEMSADLIAQALGELTKQQLGRDAGASYPRAGADTADSGRPARLAAVGRRADRRPLKQGGDLWLWAMPTRHASPFSIRLGCGIG